LAYKNFVILCIYAQRKTTAEDMYAGIQQDETSGSYSPSAGTRFSSEISIVHIKYLLILLILYQINFQYIIDYLSSVFPNKSVSIKEVFIVYIRWYVCEHTFSVMVV